MSELINLRSDNEHSWLIVDGFSTPKVDNKTLVEKFHNKIHPPTGLLPPVVKWMSPSRRYVLMERPPTIHSVSFHSAKKSQVHLVKEHNFDLPMPWTLYAIELGEDCYPVAISIFAMRHQMRSISDVLGVLPLPNHYKTGSLCMPARDYSETAGTIGQGINLAHTISWGSGFNLDINFNINATFNAKRPLALVQNIEGKGTPLKLFRNWQKLSLEQVSRCKDWVAPLGYGTAGSYLATPINRVSHLIQKFLNDDMAKSISNPAVNLAIAMKESIAACY